MDWPAHFAGLVHGQVLPGVGPAAACECLLAACHYIVICVGCQGGAVGVKLHGHGLRAYAVAVALVVPALGDGDAPAGGLVGVGHGVAAGHAAADSFGVAVRNRRLVRRIGNLLAFEVFVEAAPGEGPAVAFAERLAALHGLVGAVGVGCHGLPVGVELHGHGDRAQSIDVARIGPFLRHRHAGVLHFVGVRHGEGLHAIDYRRAADDGRVPGHRRFREGIDDGVALAAFAEHVQTAPGVGPAVVFV